MNKPKQNTHTQKDIKCSIYEKKIKGLIKNYWLIQRKSKKER